MHKSPRSPSKFLIGLLIDKKIKTVVNNSEEVARNYVDEIRNSIENLKAELDKIESLFENLEEAIKGD